MWLIILAICILVTILEMFSRTQFFTKTEGCRNFFLRPVAGLTNQGHVRDFRAGTPLVEDAFKYIYITHLLAERYAIGMASSQKSVEV